MRQALAALLLLYAAALVATADDKPKPIVCVVPGPRPTKNLLFVVDTSGSMGRGEFARALDALAMIAGQPIDDGKLAVLAFSDYSVRWHYAKKTWVPLPDARAVRAAETWLTKVKANGSTELGSALTVALSDPQDDLTVIVVSDGIVTDETGTLKALKRGQEARVKRKLSKARVMCFGVGSSLAYVGSQSLLAKVSKAGGGAFYRTSE